MTSSGKCIICSYYNYSDPDVKLYNFPSEKNKMDQWRKAVSGNYSFLSPSKRSFICALHFEPECVSENGELTEHAVPSVWLEYSEAEDGYMKGKKRSRKTSTKKNLNDESDNDEAKEESVTVMPDIVLPDDFIPHQNEESEQKKKLPKVKETPGRKTPRRKSAVIVVPKEAPDPESESKDSDDSNDDGDPDERSLKRPRNGKVKKEAPEKKPPKPF